MCVDESVPIVSGIKNHDCNHDGKVLYESVKINYEWTRETVVDNDFVNCDDGWFWDGEEGCSKVINFITNRVTLSNYSRYSRQAI